MTYDFAARRYEIKAVACFVALVYYTASLYWLLASPILGSMSRMFHREEGRVR